MKVIAKKPLFCLPRALHKPLTRHKLFMKGEKRIFEHSVHQCRLRAHGGEFDPTVEELLRQFVVIGRRLIPGVPVCRSRLGWVAAPMGGFGFGVHLILHFCISYTVIQVQYSVYFRTITYGVMARSEQPQHKLN